MSNVLKMLSRGGAAAAETDPNFNQTVLLLHGDGTNGAQNNTFLDSSTNNFTITRNGNTTQGTFSPFSLAAGEWSNYFDGNGDYLSVANNAAFQFGTGNFTVEFWVYANSSSTNHGLVAASLTGSGYWASLIFSGLIYWQSQNGTTNLFSTSYAGYYNKWTHVAFVRNSGTTKLYLDGIEAASASDSTNYNGSSGNYDIGRDQDNTALLTGYLSNVRVVKGSAVYTSNFTPSTTPLTAITNTSLLTCRDNRFRDASTNNFTITRTGDVRVTPFSPFAPTAAYSAGTNGGSGFFDGTGDYLTVANNSAFDFAGGDFTIEGWFYRQAAVTQRIIAKRATGTGFGPFLIAISGGQVSFFASFNGTTNGLTLNSSVSANLSEWNHFAVTRSGSSWTLWLNGASSATTTNASSLVANTDAVSIGVGSADGTSGIYTGYLADIRFVKGTAVYTSAFTPPTAPVTNISNTSLLLNFTNAGIIDNTGKNVLETVGNAQIDTTTKKYGTGSLEFDGTGDYLLLQNSLELAFGTGAFTIEFWYYSNDTGVANLIYDGRPAGLNGAYVTISKSTGNVITFYTNTANQITGTTSLAANTWYHIAVARSGTSTKLFINGTQEGSTYTDSNNYINGTSRPIIGAGGNILGNLPINGYLDDLRITNGVARYTTNFTAPTKEFPDQ
jgi:hypothetical protein